MNAMTKKNDPRKDKTESTISFIVPRCLSDGYQLVVFIVPMSGSLQRGSELFGCYRNIPRIQVSFPIVV